MVDLLDYDVKFGQGFLFSPPRPVRAEALQGVAERNDVVARESNGLPAAMAGGAGRRGRDRRASAADVHRAGAPARMCAALLRARRIAHADLHCRDVSRRAAASIGSFSPPPFTPHFSTLAAAYDVVLCDVWGVVHNSVVAFADACDALDAVSRARAAPWS